MNTLTIDQLRTLLHTHFPVDATCWSKATDEVRDMSRLGREILGRGEEHALNFRNIHSPKEWNTQGNARILQQYELMNNEQRAEFCMVAPLPDLN